MHPLSGEHGVLPNCRGGVWREVSIAGDIYGLRRARSDRGAGKQVFGVFIYGAPKMPAALGRRGDKYIIAEIPPLVIASYI